MTRVNIGRASSIVGGRGTGRVFGRSGAIVFSGHPEPTPPTADIGFPSISQGGEMYVFHNAESGRNLGLILQMNF